MATKSIIANLNKCEKLDGDNYDIQHRKIQYLLNEQEFLETTEHVMVQPKEGIITQHHHDLEAYNNWCNKYRCARFTISMHNDLISVFLAV